MVDKTVKNAIDLLRVEFAKPFMGSHLPLPENAPPERFLDEADRNNLASTPCRKCGEPVTWDRTEGLLLHDFTGDRKCSYIIERRKEQP
jgi:hypothetical protein